MQARPTVRAICLLTPAASAEIGDVAIARIEGLSRYRDSSHARTIVRRERLQEEWRIATTHLNLNFAETYILDLAFVTLFQGYDRLYRVIGPEGPWLVPDGAGWVSHVDRRVACLALSRHILGRYWHMVGNFFSKPPPFAGIYRLIRSILIFLGRRRRLAWVTTRSDHPLGLERALKHGNPSAVQWHFSSADGGILEYARLGREFLRCVRGAFQLQLRSIPYDPGAMQARATRAIELFPDPHIKALMREFSPAILRVYGIAAGCSVDFTAMLKRLKPDFMLASEISDGISAALFAACGQTGVPRTVASHNSFAPVSTPLNMISMRDQIGHQYAGADAEQMLFWTPSGLAGAQQAFPSKARNCRGVAPAAPAAAPAAPPNAQFKVLHASNCLRYFSRADWIYENVDEFVAGAVILMQAGLKVDNTTYLLRTKVRRFEMDEDVLRTALPASNRIEIAFRHTRPFAEDLRRSDLLVAFRSTTIMQALYARKPVLQWGVTARYRELKGRNTPPTATDRAAVYTVTDPDALPAMLAGIRDAHHGRPLNDEELKPYLFETGATTIAQWAQNCSTSAFA